MMINKLLLRTFGALVFFSLVGCGGGGTSGGVQFISFPVRGIQGWYWVGNNQRYLDFFFDGSTGEVSAGGGKECLDHSVNYQCFDMSFQRRSGKNVNTIDIRSSSGKKYVARFVGDPTVIEREGEEDLYWGEQIQIGGDLFVPR